MLGDPRLPERFWAKVQPEPNTGCWLWVAGTTGSNGYGLFAWGGRPGKLAHRVAYEALVAPIPAGLEIDHECFTRCCVNPEHLRLATHSQNCHRQQHARGDVPYRGVCRQGRRYQAKISINNRTIHLGLFDTPEEASAAYSAAARVIHGRFSDKADACVPDVEPNRLAAHEAIGRLADEIGGAHG